MSIAEFSSVIKSEAYKQWIKEVDKNIANSTVDSMRSAEQRAEKTDFYLTSAGLKDMYKNVTGLELSSARAKTALRKIRELEGSVLAGKVLRVGKSSGIFFESVGFDTITSRVASVFDDLQGVQEAYKVAAEKFLAEKTAEINSTTYKDSKTQLANTLKQDALTGAEKQASKIGFGYFLHKGHVVSIATNSAKKLRDSLVAASEFQEEQKSLLLGVLDSYIKKLEKDDLASANLPNAINQELYAKYIKSPSKYLVEIQLKTTNIASGSASLPIVTELRKIFNTADNATAAILSNSPTLGKKLLQTKGSPSWLDLLAIDMASIISTGKKATKIYEIAPTLVSKTITKLKKPSNTKEVAKLKAQKAKIIAAPKIKVPDKQELDRLFPQTNLTSLQNLINSQLQDVISANMGGGSERNVLNYRTGRFAASAAVERMSESRAGMITAFYQYQKNPYQTFEPGYKQGSPKTRDPKLLIAKSIREIAATRVGNRLRAVLV